MSKPKWKYRSYPGPTAAHLWGPKDTHSLCGKMKLSVGEWKRWLPHQPQCQLCLRREERNEQLLQMVTGTKAGVSSKPPVPPFVLPDKSRVLALAQVRTGIALGGHEVTRDVALAAVLTLAVVAVDAGVTWAELQKALRHEYALAKDRAAAAKDSDQDHDCDVDD